MEIKPSHNIILTREHPPMFRPTLVETTYMQVVFYTPDGITDPFRSRNTEDSGLMRGSPNGALLELIIYFSSWYECLSHYPCLVGFLQITPIADVFQLTCFDSED